jgi:hypothetical protein
MGGHPRQGYSCTHSVILAGIAVFTPPAHRTVINPS